MKRFFLFLIVILLAFPAVAQKSELGFFGGTSFYLGDLNRNKLFAKSQFAGGVVYRYNVSPRWAVRANIIFASVQGSDMETNNQDPRNLSFRSPITEISAQVELNFLRLYTDREKNKFAPYIFGGFAVFSFNPKTELDGKIYDLQPLGTEGQGMEGEKKKYSLTSFAIPFGMGLKYNISKVMTIGIEWGMRLTFTDYLDDVSGTYYDNMTLHVERGELVAKLADRSDVLHEAGTGRGNVTTKDWYSFAGVTITLRFGNEDKTCHIDNGKRPYTRLGVKKWPISSKPSKSKKVKSSFSGG